MIEILGRLVTLLSRVEVTPLYGQVEMSDLKQQDYPLFQTGQEPAVGTTSSILVATRGDFEGKVTVEVWTEELEVERADIQEVYEGDLQLTEQAVGRQHSGERL